MHASFFFKQKQIFMSEPDAKRLRVMLSPKILAGAINARQWERVVNLASHRKIGDVINEAYEGLTPMQRFVLNGCYHDHHNSAVFDALVAVDGFDADAHGPNADRPIVEALKGQANLTFAALVECGARVDVVTRRGMPSLLCALEYNTDIDISVFTDFAATDSHGANAFHYVRSPVHFRALMQRVPHLMDAPDNRGVTPLLAISGWGYQNSDHVMCAELFIENGALIPAGVQLHGAGGTALRRIVRKYGGVDEMRRSFCAPGSHTKSAAKRG
jgi:hypothetical protein